MEKSFETKYKKEMKQLGIDNLECHILDCGYQHYTMGERMAINLALKLQRQLNEMKKSLKT